MILVWRSFLCASIALGAASVVAGCAGGQVPRCDAVEVMRYAADCRLRAQAECSDLDQCPLLDECEREIDRRCPQ